MATGGELLPTPRANDAVNSMTAPGAMRHVEAGNGSLGEVLGHYLLPTPRATRGGSNTETVELLPTPNAQDGNGGGRYSSEGHQSTLPGEVRLLPTPLARDGRQAAPGDYARHTPSLAAVDYYLPTPTMADVGRGHVHPDRRKELNPKHSPELAELARHIPISQWGKYEAAIRRWEQVTRPAPSPTEPNKNGNPRLSAAFSEWMLGWPEGWVTQVPGISRNDQLRIVGNGVCPQQCAAALRYLLTVAEVAA